LASDSNNVMPMSANGTTFYPGYACTGDGNTTWTATAAGNENRPINCVNWYAAYAFCIWDGGFLPSDAEWEYAAAGGSQEREYPWGSIEPGTNNEYAIYDCDYGGSGPGTCTGATNIAPVGMATIGAGLWGQLDLAGNVWEWNLNVNDSSYSCTDCAVLQGNLGSTFSRIARGGEFSASQSLLSPVVASAPDPTGRDTAIGFRCSRTP
jgi:sulfatase modifying factor 1